LVSGFAVALGIVNISAFKRGPFARPVEKAWSKQVKKKLSEPSVPEADGLAGFFGEEGDDDRKSKTDNDDETSLPSRRTFISRPAAAESLSISLDPDDAGAFYYVVYGPAGCGKTTLIREALRAHIVKKGKRDDESISESSKSSSAEKNKTCSLPFGGAAYVDAASSFPLDFGRELAAAIGFSFEEGLRTADRITKALTGGGARALLSSSSADADAAAASGLTTPQQQRQDSLARAAAALEEAAETAAAAGKGRPLIVVDGADKLAQLDPDAFLDLARLAARWSASSSRSTPVVALVIGDPAALRLLRASPSGSRALLEPPISVPGPTEEEASRFLSARGVPRKDDGDENSPSSPPSPSRSPPQQPILEAARGDWLSLEKAARIVRQRDKTTKTVTQAAVEAARELVEGPSERRFAAAGLLDSPREKESQLGSLAAVRALCFLREKQQKSATSSSSHLPPPPTLPPALWRQLVPSRQHQNSLLFGDPALMPPPGTKPCLRYVEGRGLAFASSADESFACSRLLGSSSSSIPSPPLARCLGDARVWEAAGQRAEGALRASSLSSTTSTSKGGRSENEEGEDEEEEG